MSKLKPSPVTAANKYRAAIEVLQRGRDQLMAELADTVLDQADDLLEGGFAFHEFLENQGTRVHFLCLLLAQLEQSADSAEEPRSADDLGALFEFELEADEGFNDPGPIPAPAKPVRKRKATAKPKPRGGGKKLSQQSAEGSSEEL